MEYSKKEENCRRKLQKWQSKAMLLCVLFLISFQLFMSVLVTGTRNGINKTVADADDINTEWVSIGDGVRQEITLTHSFNGISLRLKNKGLAVKNIHIRVVNKETGEELFSKTGSSFLLSPSEYTYFASDVVIEIPEKTTAELYVNGGNYTLLEVSDSIENGTYGIGENNSTGSIVYGIISDYHRLTARIYLLIAAIVIAMLGIAVLIVAWDYLKHSTVFFSGYFIAVTVAFLVVAAFSTRTDYSYYSIGTSPDEEVELNDSISLDIFAVVPDYPIRGLVLQGFAANDHISGDEELHVDISDPDTGRILQESENALSDFALENPYYIVAFDDTYSTGKMLNFHIYTEGLIDNSISLTLSNETMSEMDSLYLNGQKSDGHIFASFYSGEQETGISKSTVGLYLAAIILGIILYLLHKRKGLPIRIAGPKTRAMQFATVKKNLKISYTIIPILIIIAISIIYAEYIFTYSVGNCVGKNSASEEIAAVGDLIWVSPVGVDGAITEKFTAEDDNLSGVGLILGYKDHWEDLNALKDKASSQQIVLQLYDAEDDSLLEEKTYSVNDLLTQGKTVWSDVESTIDSETLERNVFFTFPEIIDKSKGKTYRLVVSTPVENDLRIGLINQAAGSNMPLLVLHHTYSWVWIFFTIIIGTTVLLICLISIFMRHTELEIWQVFFISMVMLGGVYSFLIPPYCVPDEKIHINTVYQLSNHICGMYETTGLGTMLQGSKDITRSFGNTMKVTAGRYGDLFFNLFRKTDRDTYVLTYIQTALHNVSALNYVPAVIGFTIARAFNVSMVTMIMAARWCNLLVVALIMSLGIRKMPFGKMSLVAVGLLPVMLQQVASCSYDGILLAAVFLFIGYVFAIEEEDEVSICRILLLIGAGYLLATEKGGVYLPVLGLLLLLPGIKKNKKIKKCIPAICILLVLGVGYKYSYLVKSFMSGIVSAQSSNPVYDPNALMTPAYILFRPIELLHLIENTVIMYGDELLSEIGGNELGDMTLYVPNYITISFLLCVALASLRIKGEEQRFTERRALYISMLCGIGILLITFAMLFSYTNIRSSYITGIQGRYFLPYIILLALLLKRSKFVNTGRSNNQFVFSLIFLHLFVVGHVFLSVF